MNFPLRISRPRPATVMAGVALFLAAVPAGSGNGAAPARLSDPIARAMQAGDRRAGDVMWFGGMTFRMEGQR